ncbi:hypothetical protein OfM1_14480 [Lactovum odontotermitis]
MQALGMIETKGTLAAIEAADVMLKTADVRLLDKNHVTGGLIMISVVGDVAAAKASVDAAKSAVEKLGDNLLYGTHVIPRPDAQLEGILKKETKVTPDESQDEEKTAAKEPISLEEAIASKDKTAIQERLEETTLAELRKFTEAHEIDVPDLAKITKKKLIEILVSELTEG